MHNPHAQYLYAHTQQPFLSWTIIPLLCGHGRVQPAYDQWCVCALSLHMTLLQRVKGVLLSRSCNFFNSHTCNHSMRMSVQQTLRPHFWWECTITETDMAHTSSLPPIFALAESTIHASTPVPYSPLNFCAQRVTSMLDSHPPSNKYQRYLCALSLNPWPPITSPFWLYLFNSTIILFFIIFLLINKLLQKRLHILFCARSPLAPTSSSLQKFLPMTPLFSSSVCCVCMGAFLLHCFHHTSHTTIHCFLWWTSSRG